MAVDDEMARLVESVQAMWLASPQGLQTKRPLPPARAKWLAKFLHETSRPDDSAILLLKGHLLLDEILSSIVAIHVTHIEPLDGIRLDFSTRLRLARALRFEGGDEKSWHLVAAINSLRNEMAHKSRGSSAKWDDKVLNLRRACDALPSASNQPSMNDRTEANLINNACASALGFLSKVEAEADEARQARHAQQQQIAFIRQATSGK